MTNKKTPLLLILINFFFVLVAILILFNFFPKNLFQKKQDTFNVIKERIELTIPAKGFISKHEVLYKAPIDGKLKRIKQPPELLAKNEEAVQIQDSTSKKLISVKVNDSGFITYIKDGIEETYSYDILSKKTLTEEEIASPPANQIKVSDDEEVKKGDFIFKIVENDLIYFFLILDKNDKEKLSIGNNFVFSITDPQNITTSGVITKMVPINDKKFLVIFESSFYIEPLLNIRKISGSFTFPFITASYIPEKAVGKKKDAKGVDHYYILVKSEIDGKVTSTLTEIKIIAQRSYHKDFIVENVSESLSIFRDFQEAEKKYKTSGK